MADPMYNIGVRKSLNDMGVGDERISFDPNSGYVSVDNQKIFKPQSNVEGSTYTDQASLNSIRGNVNTLNNAYNVQQKVMNPQQNANPYDDQFNQLLSTLQQRTANPQVVDRNAIYASPQYAAQQAQAQRQAGQAIRSGQEALGTSGMARSSDLARFAQNAQIDANQYLETQVLPQLIAQEENRQRQQTNDIMSILGLVGQQQGVYDTRNQNQFNNQFNVLDFLTGRQDRADETAYRDSRDAIGDQRYTQEFQYQQARDQIADEQAKLNFDEDVRRYGLDYAMRAADQANVFANRAADNKRSEEASQLARDRFDYEKSQVSQQSDADFEEERRGLVEVLRSGELTPAQAYQQIGEDQKLGFYTPEQANQLRSMIEQLSPTVQTTPDLTAEQRSEVENAPSQKQLERLYAEQGQGKPKLDWMAWYRDPNGRIGGVDFDTWARVSGPRLGARK